MGMLSVTQYDQTPEFRFFLCKACHTHIALSKELVKPDNPAIFKNAVNLVIDTPEHHYKDSSFGQFPNYTVANVYCVECNSHLGKRIVQVDPTPPDNRSSVREGRILIEMEKLMYWTGRKMIEASTLTETLTFARQLNQQLPEIQ